MVVVVEDEEEDGQLKRRAVAGDGRRYVSRGPEAWRVVRRSTEGSAGHTWRTHSMFIVVRC